jgi:GAF domain-containing protein
VTDTRPTAPVATEPASSEGAGNALAKIAELAKRTIPGASEVSVTLLGGAGAHTAAFTGRLALELDEWQYGQGHGPCLDASRAGDTLTVPDMRAETRWPDWAARALRAGSRSSLSIGLPAREHVTGAFNVYATEPDAFDDTAITIARVFADYAAVALSDDRHHEAQGALARHLQTAMDRRTLVEQAKGIIMGDRHCTPNEAATILNELSRYTNRSQGEIAAALVERAALRDG